MEQRAVVPIPSVDRVAVVIPAFRAAATIEQVLAAIGPEVWRIYLVDDDCPDLTGDRAGRARPDPRLTVLRNPRNLGVGGAMKHGYRRALADGAQIVVKLDADGQMDPAHIPLLVKPILAGSADYAKGNRFARPDLMPAGVSPLALKEMPKRRRLANTVLSLLHKGATGYWRIVDPANGYTAIHSRTLERLGIDSLADCFFFETDMLYRLNLIEAVVIDIPLPARYPGTGSNLSLRRVGPRFLAMTALRCGKRIRAKYFNGPWNRGSTAFALAFLMFGGAALLAAFNYVVASPSAALVTGFCLFLALISLASAIRHDSRVTTRDPFWLGALAAE